MSPAMPRHSQSGQANLTAVFLLLGLVVSGVWVWKRLSPDMQDLIIDQAIPLAALALVVVAVVWVLAGKIRTRRKRNQQRARLITLFESQTSADKRLQLAFAVIELNEYQRAGLEAVAPRFQELFLTTLKRALGDKQHQVRGGARGASGRRSRRW